MFTNDLKTDIKKYKRNCVPQHSSYWIIVLRIFLFLHIASLSLWMVAGEEGHSVRVVESSGSQSMAPGNLVEMQFLRP